MKKNEVGKGWAWRCDFGVCYWAEPTREKLLAGHKPSPEARAIAVRIVPLRKYRELTKRVDVSDAQQASIDAS